MFEGVKKPLEELWHSFGVQKDMEVPDRSWGSCLHFLCVSLMIIRIHYVWRYQEPSWRMMTLCWSLGGHGGSWLGLGLFPHGRNKMTEGDEMFYTRYISAKVTIKKRSYYVYYHTNKLPHSLQNLHDLKKPLLHVTTLLRLHICTWRNGFWKESL